VGESGGTRPIEAVEPAGVSKTASSGQLPSVYFGRNTSRVGPGRKLTGWVRTGPRSRVSLSGQEYFGPVHRSCRDLPNKYDSNVRGRRISFLFARCRYLSNLFIFTVRRYALHSLCYRNSVCPSVCLFLRLSHSCTVSTWLYLRS